MSCIQELSICLKIEINESYYCYTNHDRNIKFEDFIYTPVQALKINNLLLNDELGEDNISLSIMFDNQDFNYYKANANKLISKRIELVILERDFVKQPRIKFVKAAYIGEISFHENICTIQASGISTKFNTKIGNVFSSSCRAILGDNKCGINLDKFSFKGEIHEIISNECIRLDDCKLPDLFFLGGILELSTGKSKNSKFIIYQHQDNFLHFKNRENSTFELFDKFIITPACDKTLQCCKDKFSNVLNFRGEPFIPSNHKLAVAN